MKDKHLIVVSVDALVYEDLEYAATLPAFGKILKEGALIQRVETIYPSLTHAVHASIMTGCPAGVTGIVSNDIFEAGKFGRPWYNHLDEVKCETIFHAAKKAGLTTAACRWPVTANGDDVIDYLVPEIMGEDMNGHEDEAAEVYRRLGTSECVMDIVEAALDKYGPGHTHPEYDEFEIWCAAEIIRRFKPNILFSHPGYVDSERHRTGLFSDYVRESVRVTDEWLTMLLEAVHDAGIEDSTDFVVLSDHGHLGIQRTLCPNVFLADAGLIRTDAQGNLVSWDAYICGCGLSGQVYLSRPEDEALKSQVFELLRSMAREGIYGFERVFTLDEVRERYGLDGAFSFVIETDGFTSFSEDWKRPVVRGFDLSDYRFGHSTHGHMPEKGPQPPFMGMGPSFKKGAVLAKGHILDHAATFAKILGIDLPQAQGKPADVILDIV